MTTEEIPEQRVLTENQQEIVNRLTVLHESLSKLVASVETIRTSILVSWDAEVALSEIIVTIANTVRVTNDLLNTVFVCSIDKLE